MPKKDHDHQSQEHHHHTYRHRTVTQQLRLTKISSYPPTTEAECPIHQWVTSDLNSQNTRTQQRKCAPCWDPIAPARNGTYGSWLVEKILEELEKILCVEELYLRSLQSNIDSITEYMESMMLWTVREVYQIFK